MPDILIYSEYFYDVSLIFGEFWKKWHLSKISIACINPSRWGINLVILCFIIFYQIPIHG